ncbi:MucR family transcriptional regulator [Mesorhizobium sp. NBSH29]|uniref:MucR family transcriptional regulator n=1 Tax=Mesorhizobium sp. NBSH29 TaxID=2654249 RepID=UPI0035BC81BE
MTVAPLRETRLNTTMTEEIAETKTDSIGLTTNIAAAYVSENPVRQPSFPVSLPRPTPPVPGLAAGATAEQPEEKPVPAVAVRKSVTPDFLICLEMATSLSR